MDRKGTTMTTTQSALAVNGGTPVRAKPMPPRHLFGPEERAAALALFDEAMHTGGVISYNGAHEQAFEQDFATFMGGGFADGVNSGTSAVFAALGALRLPTGSEVVVPPITDPGGAMPVVMLNCIPVFCDGDGRSYNMGPEQLEAVVTDRTRAIIVAHIAGEPADLDGIMAIAKKHNLRVIEDCAQSHAATFKGQKVGTFGDIAAFSTMSGKHFATAAQGGIVYTKDEELHWLGKRFADRGKPFNLEGATSNVMAGLNLNLNDLSAAVGRVQLRKLPWVVARRQKVGEGVQQGIAGLQAVSVGWQHPEARSSYWFLRMAIDLDRLAVGVTEFYQALQAEGIPASAHYRHIQCEADWFRNRRTDWCPWQCAEDDREYTLSNAIRVMDYCFNIAIHENYGEREIQDIIDALVKVEAAYLK
jgi:dTDP-4-amino-4,6-dideoxygalactose transaminase